MYSDVTNVIDLIIAIFIERKYGIVKKTPNTSHQGLLLKTVSLVLIHSNISTIKWSVILVLSGKTISTETGIVRNSKSSEKVEFLHITK